MKYIWEDVSYWASNGCDCCEDTYMEGYNCTSHEITYTVSDYPEVYRTCIWEYLGYDLDDYDFLERS